MTVHHNLRSDWVVRRDKIPSCCSELVQLIYDTVPSILGHQEIERKLVPGHNNCSWCKQTKIPQFKAREHEAIKWGEIIPAIWVRTYAKEIGADPTYEDSGNDFDDSASEDFEMGPVVASTSSTIPDNDAMDLDWTANNVSWLLNHLVINWFFFLDNKFEKMTTGGHRSFTWWPIWEAYM